MNFHAPETARAGERLQAVWFVAQLKPNGYGRAKLNLARQGFDTFMPLVERSVRHARVECLVLRPLFPGYIFISFDPNATQWRTINNTFGVRNLIMGGGNSPASVPQSLMKSLLTACDANGKMLPPTAFSAGEKVRIMRGAFQDMLAEVQHASDGERVLLLLDIMGRAVSTDCSSRELEILSA